MTDLDKQEVRHTTLSVLAMRHPTALTARKILNRVAQEVDLPLTEADIEAALAFLHGLSPTHVEVIADEFGAGQAWRATSAGVLSWERQSKRDYPRHD